MSLHHLVRRQGGVLALWQAVDAGMSAATVQRRAREGSWERLHPAVYLVAGHRLTDEVRVRAAWLWAGEKAVVSGPAAAYWHGMLDRAPRPVEITVPRGRSPRCPAGVRVRRRDLAPADVVGQRDLWLTAAHVDADRFRADRRKQNALVRAGWDPLRFTWHDLDRRPAAVLDEIEETLRLAEAPSRSRSTG